jgi:hypothetical protein
MRCGAGGEDGAGNCADPEHPEQRRARQAEVEAHLAPFAQRQEEQ